jgi:hypothetical protein
MDPKPSQRRSRLKHSSAIWFFAVWNVLVWLNAAYATYQGRFNEADSGGRLMGVVHADHEPGKFWLMVLALPAFGAIMMAYFVVGAVREARRQRESAG